MALLKIFLFGLPRLEHDGQALMLRRRKALALVCYLAVKKQPQGRDSLCALLWPDFDRDSAQNNLRRELSLLKRSLGEGVLVADRFQVGFDTSASVWVDVDEFWIQLAQARLQSTVDYVSTLTRAASIYTHDFLAGFSLPDSLAFDEWQFFEAESLRRALAEALQTLIQAHLDREEYYQGVEVCRRWVALDALHEPAQRQLMQLLSWAGEHTAALHQYDQCVRLLDEELGVSPEAETSALVEAIRVRQLAPPERGSILDDSPSSPVHNLPSSATPFIGRAAELNKLHQLIGDPTVQLLTILAPGGMGKSRLAIEVGRGFVDPHNSRYSLPNQFPDGVYFVPMASLKSPNDIMTILATLAGYQLRADDRDLEQQICDFLSARRILLILDSFEHVLATTKLVSKIMGAATGVKILATSRESLNLYGEATYTLEPLGFPDATASHNVLECDAARLFIQIAHLARTDFLLQPGELHELSLICQLAEGMPLALELAAARADMLSVQEIASELTRSLDFLETHIQDMPPRQRSIRAVFNSTWDRLSEAERTVFMKVSVFLGGFTRQAGKKVAEASLRDLTILANKALIHRNLDGRYEIHDLLRQYAEEKLDQSGTGAAIRDAHSLYYLKVVAHREADIRGRDQIRALDDIASDIANIRAAWVWAVEHGHFDTVHAATKSLTLFFDMRTRYREGVELFQLAEEQLTPMPTDKHKSILAHIRTCRVRSQIFSFPGLPPIVFYEILEDCLATARKHGSDEDIAFCTFVLSDVRSLWRKPSQRQQLLIQESLNLYRELGDQFYVAEILDLLALNAKWEDPIEAVKRQREALELKQSIGDVHGAAWMSFGLSLNSYHAGFYEDAERYGRSMIDEMIKIKSPSGLQHGYILMGMILFANGNLNDAESKLRIGLELMDNNKNYADHDATLMIFLACIAIINVGDTADFLEIMERAEKNPRPGHYTGIELLHLLIACEEKHYQAARSLYQPLLEYDVTFSNFHRVVTVAVEAVVQADEGHQVRAVELLSCAFHQPLGLSGWLGQWKLMSSLQAELEADLGTEAYQAARERGIGLDLETGVLGQ